MNWPKLIVRHRTRPVKVKCRSSLSRSSLSRSSLSRSSLSGSSVAKSWRGDVILVPQRDDEEFYIDNEHLIRLVEERIQLWDSRDQQYKDTVVTRQLWNEVAAAMDDWDSSSPTSKKAFMNKVRTCWRSMEDRFDTDVRAEGQVCSGSAARRRRKYRYHRELAFLRPVLASRITCSSTLQPVPGAALHRTTSDPSQPSDSQEASCSPCTFSSRGQQVCTSDRMHRKYADELPASPIPGFALSSNSETRQVPAIDQLKATLLLFPECTGNMQMSFLLLQSLVLRCPQTARLGKSQRSISLRRLFPSSQNALEICR
ncbi:uncharacterized protein [Dendrobates tinctorius]|uniref:uncharacterized protein n=1 Tax=Dendrobates tinctorius TaxID=92724 RepID=UPI003CC98AE0